MLYNPYCSPSTSRVTKKSEANYILPGLVISFSRGRAAGDITRAVHEDEKGP